MLCFDSCYSQTLRLRASSLAAVSLSSATQHPHPDLYVSAALAGPHCCRSADVFAAAVPSGQAIHVVPASILIVMALQSKILLPYAVIWNAADTVVKGPRSVGCLQADVAQATFISPRTWNILGTRHHHALLNFP
jgi:hypothetical protein